MYTHPYIHSYHLLTLQIHESSPIKALYNTLIRHYCAVRNPLTNQTLSCCILLLKNASHPLTDSILVVLFYTTFYVKTMLIQLTLYIIPCRICHWHNTLYHGQIRWPPDRRTQARRAFYSFLHHFKIHEANLLMIERTAIGSVSKQYLGLNLDCNMDEDFFRGTTMVQNRCLYLLLPICGIQRSVRLCSRSFDFECWHCYVRVIVTKQCFGFPIWRWPLNTVCVPPTSMYASHCDASDEVAQTQREAIQPM